MTSDAETLLQLRLTRVYREVILGALGADRVSVRVEAWQAPGEPVAFTEAVGQDYTPLKPGDAWGPPWGTTWLRIADTIPADWEPGDVDLVVDLGFSAAHPGFQSEGMFWSEAGEPVKGLEPRNQSVRIRTPLRERMSAFSSRPHQIPISHRTGPFGRPHSVTAERRVPIRNTASLARGFRASTPNSPLSSGTGGRCTIWRERCNPIRPVGPAS
jgi:hypothetical protein